VRGILHPRGMLILTAACFVAMTLAVLLAGAHPADGAARDSLLALNTPVVVAVMRVITQLGHAWFLVPATAALLAVFAEARASSR
jgi:hypothetical protein